MLVLLIVFLLFSAFSFFYFLASSRYFRSSSPPVFPIPIPVYLGILLKNQNFLCNDSLFY
ncbi:hypothetical protein Fmac_003999 [Flemingia macrophylla]|uniref:Uncharacterized protein n=1 Tax=Flemingia macrophylla TaxID=520843 RepID=A0ABD1N3Q9_9FABA